MKNKLLWGALPVIFFAGLLIGNIFVFKTKEQGQILYEQHCASCHMEKGEGLAQLIPPVTKSDWLAQNPSKLACLIRYGQKGEITVNGIKYNQPMPPNSRLTEIEIHNLVNYIFNNFENQVQKRSLDKIREDLNTCN